MEVVNESGLGFGWTAGKIAPPQWSATFIVKGAFRLRPGRAAAPVEEHPDPTGDEYVEQDPKRALRYAMDFAYLKPRADLTLMGTCHAPGGKPVTATTVSFQVGQYAKRLAVIGDRTWRGFMGPTPPAPFARMPVTYERAYGGPGFAPNPLGRGSAEVAGADGRRVRPMPNIEHPDRLITDPGRGGDPAGFGPIPMTWPQRAGKAGTYGGKWQAQRWPWYPEDFDWGFFNAAPADQQLPGFLRGDEALAFGNLHPAHPQYESRLPGLRARCFLAERVRASVGWREVPLSLDTLWVDIDAEALALVWRGNVPMPDPKLEEVIHVLVVTEPVSEPPRPAEHYRGALAAALARQAEEEAEELEAEEPPEAPEEPEEAEEPPEADEPPDEEAPPPPAPEETREEELAALRKMKESLLEFGKPVPPEVDAQIAALAAATEIEEPAEEPEEEEPPEEPPEEPEPLGTVEAAERIRLKQSLEGEDLAGWTLDGLDLGGMNLREAILQGALLRGASLKASDLTGASLEGANLARADLENAILAGADLAGADLSGANLAGADLRGADLSGAVLRSARMAGVKAGGALFAEADLSGADLSGADLPEADLSSCRLHGTDLTGAALAAASLEEAWGHRLRADGAALTKAKASGARLTEASFRNAAADGSVWEGAELYGAAFAGARLAGAEFSSAYLGSADFTSADLREARLNEAVLAGARAPRANFLAASLQQADLSGADLRGSNLYGASLVDANLKDALLEGANMKLTKTGKTA